MKIQFPKTKLKFKIKHYKHILNFSRFAFWFSAGVLITLFFISSFGLFIYQQIYGNKVYPGVYVNNMDFGGKTKDEVRKFFLSKNSLIGDTTFVLTLESEMATISAKQINYGYDANLSSDQAYSVGRSGGVISNLSLILQAYINGIKLPATYTYDSTEFLKLTKPISTKIDKKPIDAVFKTQNGRVSTFKPSSNGQAIDIDSLNKKLANNALQIMSSGKSEVIVIPVPIKITEPAITTEKANNMGIKELIGEGHSLFFHSIPSRVHNVNLGATRVNGVLVAPGEIFSFNKALGDVSAFTGYQQAYVIQNGKTVLGDGGGICQVSTTFFRAVLDAGLPIVERHAHAYRVGYYEEDSPPGIDATIFTPTVDLRFKNDTDNYILVQSEISLENFSLAFYLYGTKDNRQITMTAPVVSNIIPAPPDLYVDDPTLPKGEIKQTDFAAAGATAYFTRKVVKDGKEIISDKFTSVYRPWQANYLRGTKE